MAKNNTSLLMAAAAAGGLLLLTRKRSAARVVVDHTKGIDAAGAPLPPGARRGDRASEPQRVPGDPMRVGGPSDNPIICAAWKTGAGKPEWGDSEIAAIDDAVNHALASYGAPDWASLPEAKIMGFEVAKSAIASVCPTVELPADRSELDKEYPTAPFWWKRIWDAFYTRSWTRVMESGGGAS